MNHLFRLLLACFVLGPASSAVPGPAPSSMAFTVSMERPSTHYFHVAFRCSGLQGESQDLKLPVWSPGYYMIMDYPKNLVNFNVQDDEGHALPWNKTAKNTWRVKTGGAKAFTVDYDVYAWARSIAESSLDDGQAFISPTSLFLHVAGRIQHPVSVTLKPCAGWNRISTGLDSVESRPNTYTATDFDVLYDSPILLGNQEVMSFEVQGILHTFVGRDLGHFDRVKFISDLKAMVESAAKIMGEIPYKHYTFISIGPGGGGLEHLNSQVITFSADSLSGPEGYKRTMSFISHEYFHHYNVKRIRPIALGPFDYDRENYTNLLWVSEGFTVYYQDQVLVRSGFYSPDAYLERVRRSIRNFETIPGHRSQSAVGSSFDTWFGYFNHNEHQQNTTISYYDKGLALAVLLDFKIRHETRNRKSLDDVMRNLYKFYYKEKGRGFTDQEFRQVCEDAAGCPLPEIFDVYATTTQDIDYQKYFAYAGLEIEVEPKAQPGGYLGAELEEQGGHAVISRVVIDSPASQAGLSIQDEILSMDGARTGAPGLRQMLLDKKHGDPVKILFARRGTIRELNVTLGTQTDRSFQIKPTPNPDPLQASIRESWLKGR